MAKKTSDSRGNRKPADPGRVRPQYAGRARNVNLFPTFVPVLVFSGAVLWAAANRGNSIWVVSAFALGLGAMIAFLAPRRKVLLGSLPALGTFLTLLVLELGGGWAGLREVADYWVPVSLSAIVGALLGTRLKIRL